MKKLSFVCAGAVALCGLFSGCFFESSKTLDITSVSDLYKMEENNSYNLTCDLDLNGQDWTPVKVKSFNGNNHSITNVSITSSYMTQNDQYVGFLGKADAVKDLNLSNVFINVNIAHNSLIGVVRGAIVCGEAKLAQNIHVSDSTMIVSVENKDCSEYFGGIVGGYIYTKGSIKNCTVENCNFNIVEMSGHNDWREVGGITGYSYLSEISDCKVTDCEFNIKSITNCNVGGIVGETKSSNTGNDSLNFSNLVSMNNKFDIDTASNDYAVRAGGLVGNIEHETITFEKCLVSGVEINEKALNNYCLGGLVGRNNGTVKNCLVENTKVAAELTKPKSSEYAYAGGLCGANYKSVSRCAVQDGYVWGTDSDSSEKYLSGGFAGHTEGSAAYCGVKNIDVHGNRIHPFTNNVDFETNCIDCEEWAEDILSLLKLESCWAFTDGKLALKV